MEIDVREESGGKPDVIRFGSKECDIVQYRNDRSLWIGIPEEGAPVYKADSEGRSTWQYFVVFNDEIPNLIKALKKYQELYGE